MVVKLLLDYVRHQSSLGFHNLEFPISLFRRMTCLPRLPCVIHFSRLFAAVVKSKHLLRPHSTVISLSRELHLSGIRPDSHSDCILANCFCHLGRVDFGFCVFGRSLKLGYPVESNIVFLTTLINGLVHNNQLPQAVQLLDKVVVKLGIEPSLVTYGTIIKGLCSIGDNAAALCLLRQLNSRPSSFKPNLVIYSTLIDRLCKVRLLDEALSLFSVMKTAGIKPDVFTYTSLIRGTVNLDRTEQGMEMLIEMMQSNIAPDVATYTTLINGLCKSGRIAMARQLFGDMIGYGVKPNTIAYGALLDGLCKCGQPDEAVDVFREMECNGVAPGINVYNILINSLCEAGHVEEAENLFSELPSRGCPPNSITYNTVIKALCKKGLMIKAIELLSQMEPNGCSPNCVTYNTIIKGFIANDDFSNALHYRDLKVSKGFEADNKTISLFVDLLSKKFLK